MTARGLPPVPFLRERLLSVGMLAALAPIPLFFTYALEIGLLALYLLALGLLLYRVRRGAVPQFSNTVLNLAGLAYLPVYVFDARVYSHSLLRATLHLLLFTTVFKLAAIRRERDLSVALVLCGFLFVASVSTSFHVSILLFVAAFAALAWPVLVRWSIFRDLAAAPEEWQRDPRARELPGRASLTASVGAALLLAVPFFLTLPRLRAPYVRGMVAGQEVTTGISETADPDLHGVLKRSDRVIARITAAEPLGEADASLLRLRAAAFSRWDGRVWRNPGGRRRFQPAGGGILVPLTGRRMAPVDEKRALEIDLLPLGSRYVPFPVDGSALRLPENLFRSFALAQVERDEERNVQLLWEPDRTLRYVAYYGDGSAPDLAPGSLAESSARSGSAVLARLAGERTRGLDPARDPAAAAEAVAGWLRTGFTYSLEAPPSGPGAVETFLLERQRGHCQTFATAMALLLREIGIPTRFVSGFAGGEIGPFGRYVVVRGEHAHAWVEAWCGEKGWLAFDPTPAAGVPGVTRVPLFSRLRQLSEGAEFLYDRYILGFSQGDQVELIRTLREAVATAADATRDTAARLHAALKGLTAPARRLPALAAVGLLGAAAFVGWRFLRRSRGPGRLRGLPPAATAYRKLQRILRRRGGRILASASPEETLAETKRLAPGALPAAREIVRAYVAESFAAGGEAAVPAEALRERIQSLRAALRRTAA